MPLGAAKQALLGAAGVSTGDVVLLSSQTVSDSASLSITSKITSAHQEYIFEYYNIHPETDGASFTFQCSTDGGSNYNTTTTNNTFRAYHFESDSAADLAYDASADQSQGTAFQMLAENFGSDNDQNGVGSLRLYNPSSTTFVKQFMSRCSRVSSNDNSYDFYLAGYFNTTSAINAIQFKMSSGNMNGTVNMYGVK